MAFEGHAGELPGYARQRTSPRTHWRDDDRVPALRLRNSSTTAGRGRAPVRRQLAPFRDDHAGPPEQRLHEPANGGARLAPERGYVIQARAGDTAQFATQPPAAQPPSPSRRPRPRPEHAKRLPQRYGLYTFVIVTVIALIVFTGIQITKEAGDNSDGASFGIELVRE